MPIRPKFSLGETDNFPKASRQFTDRENYIAAFHNLMKPEMRKDYNLLVFYGVGGVGKTTLRKELGRQIDAKYTKTLWTAIDLDVPTYREPEAALFVLRNLISDKYKVHFPTFDIAYTTYWHKTHPQTPMTRDNFPLLSGSNVLGGIIRVVGEMPWVGWMPKLTKAFMAGQNVFREWWKRRGEKELANLPTLEAKEIAQRLPMFWALDLRDHIEEKKVPAVIFIDTYEALWENISAEGGFFLQDEWIRELVANLPEVLWVICGREKLRWDEIEPDWKEYFEQHLIGALSDIDAKKFLSSCEIENEDIQNVIVSASRGLPHFLDLAVDTYYEIKNRYNRNPVSTDFARTQQEVLERFLRYLDRTEIETLKVLSAARVWNAELFDLLVTRFSTGYPVTAIANLCRFSFIVESNMANSWTMHELMRESLQAKQDKEAVQIVHRELFNYYNKKLSNLDVKNVSDLEKFAMNEAFYHAKISLSYEEMSEWFYNTGDIFVNAAQWRMMTPLTDEFVVYTENKTGAESSEYSKALYHQAKLYQIQGRYKESEFIFKQTLELREKLFGVEDTEVAAASNALAVLYRNQGRLSEAEPLFERSLKINEKVHGKNHPDVATCLNNLASIYDEEGKYKEAEPLYLRSTEIFKDNYGEDHQYVANTLNNLAILYIYWGKDDKAEMLFKKSLEIREKVLGTEHPDFANSLNNLASFFNHKGKYAEAEPLFKKALELKGKSLGAEHPEIASSLRGLANLYISLKKFDEVEPLLQKAKSICEKSLGYKHPELAEILLSLANYYKILSDNSEVSKYKQSEKYYKEAIEIFSNSLGERHYKIAEVLDELALLYIQLSRREDAEKNFKLALDILKENFDENHPSYIEVKNNLDIFLGKK